MASITLVASPTFTSGTVTVYRNWKNGATVSGAPVGAPVTTAAVAADGTVSLTGLSEDVLYVLYQASPDRYLSFMVDDFPNPTWVTNVATQPGTALSVESASVSKGNKKLVVSGSTALSAVSGGIPAGATKALFRPDVAMNMSDDGAAADANDFPLAANVTWTYDGDQLANVHFFGTGNVYLWFFA